MLQLIRDRSQGLVVGVIVFFICLTFALFGVQQYLDARRTIIVAEVNGEKIILKDYQRAFQQLRQRAQAMLGDTFNSEQWSGTQAKLAALEYVVSERLLVQVVNEANIRASDIQVASYIRTSPQFQDDDGFSQDLYRRTVRAIGFTELGFEQQVRKDIVVNQLRAGISASSFTTVEELQRLEQLRQQSRDIGYTILGIESFREGIDPTEEEIAAYYAEQSEDYRIEERVAVEYLELSIKTLMAEVSTTDTQLRAYYESNQSNYVRQEQRNVNHILVQIAGDATADEEKIAREKAVMLRELAITGESFETIAKENSDDIGSKTDGGETGFFGRGVMAPEFEEAVFSMAEHDISEPIRTKFGWHIIRLKAINPGGVKSFDDARVDVEASFRREAAEALFFEQAEQLADVVYEHPESLDSAAEALGLTTMKTEMLTRSELALRFSDRLAAATFEPDVLLEGLNSEPIDIDNGQVIAARIAQHRPTKVPPLEDVAATVTEDLINARAREAAQERGKSLVERLNNGEDLQSVIGADDLKWQHVAGAKRNSSKINRAILRSAFRTEPGTQDKVLYSGIPIGVGDFGIVGVANAVVPPVEELNISDLSQMRRDISANRTAATWQDFMALLKSDSSVESYPERL